MRVAWVEVGRTMEMSVAWVRDGIKECVVGETGSGKILSENMSNKA